MLYNLVLVYIIGSNSSFANFKMFGTLYMKSVHDNCSHAKTVMFSTETETTIYVYAFIYKLI